MTARVKKVIEEMAELSPSEMAELVERFRELRAVNDEGWKRGSRASLGAGAVTRTLNLGQ
jgi:hypothetical protein